MRKRWLTRCAHCLTPTLDLENEHNNLNRARESLKPFNVRCKCNYAKHLVLTGLIRLRTQEQHYLDKPLCTRQRQSAFKKILCRLQMGFWKDLSRRRSTKRFFVRRPTGVEQQTYHVSSNVTVSERLPPETVWTGHVYIFALRALVTYMF